MIQHEKRRYYMCTMAVSENGQYNGLSTPNYVIVHIVPKACTFWSILTFLLAELLYDNFLVCCDFLQSKHEKEAKAVFESLHRSPQMIMHISMEQQQCKMYTVDIFKNFKDELKSLVNFVSLLLKVDGQISTFEVKDSASVKVVRMQSRSLMKFFTMKETWRCNVFAAHFTLEVFLVGKHYQFSTFKMWLKPF